VDYEKIDSNILLLGPPGSGKSIIPKRRREISEDFSGPVGVRFAGRSPFQKERFLYASKLKNFANRWIGTITANSVAAAVQCAREQARKAGLRG